MRKTQNVTSPRRGRPSLKWCRDYARASLAVKGIVAGNLKKACSALHASHSAIYRAVAFDIDGTLTKPDSPEIDAPMAAIISDLLQRGVPVLLITGRGRRSARDAANAIRGISALSAWYFRRLQCVTHNGVFLLSTPPGRPDEFLAQETPLGQKIPDLDELRARISEGLRQSPVGDGATVTLEPQSIRVSLLRNAGGGPEVYRLVRDAVKADPAHAQALHISRGAYGKQDCLDVSSVTKISALRAFAKSIGIRAGQVLRIGDQGQPGGNDHDLLDAASGFSVNKLSRAATRCHPVLSDDLSKQLRGAEATHKLLSRLMVFPSFSLEPERLPEYLPALRSFERHAVFRSREEYDMVAQRLRVRLRYLLPEGDSVAGLHTLGPNDLFDPLCGGIKFRDWELDALGDNHPILSLFGLSRPAEAPSRPPKLNFAMYTDTGLLMRGPFYYYALAHHRPKLRTYFDEACGFLCRCRESLGSFLEEPPDLTRLKLLLAICDNVRNTLLQAQYAAFVADASAKKPTYKMTERTFAKALYPHTRAHYALLFDPDADWQTGILAYEEILSTCENALRALLPKIEPLEAQAHHPELFRRWRECDHFLQNVTAVQLGLHEFRQRRDMQQDPPLCVVGLVYGGTELPAIAKVVSECRGVKLEAGYCNVSIYGDKKVGKTIRTGGQEYVRDMLFEQRPAAVLGETGAVRDLQGRSVLLMDDNCTTCVTLQLARDVLVLMGADVKGAVVVRFPGINRHAQMALPGHGFPDPEVLLSVLRGLIAPSPYTRLLSPSEGGNPYLDSCGVFDKARSRIETHLLKNGTPAIKDD